MAQSVLVIADSGSGKSTSIRDLDSKETFIINIANKPNHAIHLYFFIQFEINVAAVAIKIIERTRPKISKT